MDSSKKDLESRSLGDSDLISYLIGASNLVRLTFTDIVNLPSKFDITTSSNPLSRSQSPTSVTVESLVRWTKN